MASPPPAEVPRSPTLDGSRPLTACQITRGGDVGPVVGWADTIKENVDDNHNHWPTPAFTSVHTATASSSAAGKGWSGAMR